jgi:hypothetical protein
MNMPLAASSANIQSPSPIVLIKADKDKQNSDRFPFKFSCNLAEHPLFQLPRLVRLIDFIASQAPDQATCVATRGDSSNCNWSGRIHQERFAEIIAHAEEIGLLLLIKDAQKDPEYHSLLEQIVNELEPLVGQPLRQQQSWLETYIFIAPPIAKNRYLNGKSNFVFQVHEKKAFERRKHHSLFISSISFPGEDRTVSLNLFLVKPTVSNDREIKRSEQKNEVCVRRIERNRAPQPGARLGRDPEGTPAWYVSDPGRPGKYLQVGSVS